MTREAKDLLDMPVVTTDNGRRIGQVERLLFEPGKHMLYGFVVKPGDSSPTLFLARARVKSIGQDAITIDGDSASEVLDANVRARELGTSDRHLTGMTVMSEDGNVLGKVDRILLNDDGTVASYHASSGLLGLGSKRDIAPGEIVSAGDDAFIVSTASLADETARAQ